MALQDGVLHIESFPAVTLGIVVLALGSEIRRQELRGWMPGSPRKRIIPLQLVRAGENQPANHNENPRVSGDFFAKEIYLTRRNFLHRRIRCLRIEMF